MAKAIHVRLDPASEAALRMLRAEGRTESECVRDALRLAARERASADAIRADVARVAASEEDRAEMRAVLLELEPFDPAEPAA